LAASPAVRVQQVAFTCATGVPLTLLPASRGTGGSLDGAFCVKGCLGHPSGDLCQRRLLTAEKRAAGRAGPVQYCCPSGLVKILIPVFLEGRHAGSLLAGPFTLQSLDGERLAELMSRLESAGLGGRVRELETTWRHSPLLSAEKCRAAATLLGMFARYLEESARQVAADRSSVRSPLLAKIEEVLARNGSGRVSLRDVAARVNLSPCHFCAVFKKQTGVTFTEYRNQRRLGRAEELLRDPSRRVSDIAFEAGFDSIPYFNRAFRRHFGCSPTVYRRRLVVEKADKRIENLA
jgi:AraC-like DNA-binding protein